MIAANREKIEAISKRATDNGQKLQEVLDAASANRTAISTNAAGIAARRQQILANRSRIKENQAKVAQFIASKL